MRTVSSSIMAVLVILALFWGNCFSCPQVLQALKAHQPSHGCCHKSQKTSNECQTQVLRHFVKGTVQTPALAAQWVKLPQPLPEIAAADRIVPIEPAEPDRLSLLASFRI